MFIIKTNVSDFGGSLFGNKNLIWQWWPLRSVPRYRLFAFHWAPGLGRILNGGDARSGSIRAHLTPENSPPSRKRRFGTSRSDEKWRKLFLNGSIKIFIWKWSRSNVWGSGVPFRRADPQVPSPQLLRVSKNKGWDRRGVVDTWFFSCRGTEPPLVSARFGPLSCASHFPARYLDK